MSDFNLTGPFNFFNDVAMEEKMREGAQRLHRIRELSAQLKTCPFCGSAVAFREAMNDSDYYKIVSENPFCICANIDYIIDAEDLQEFEIALAKWNRREGVWGL